MSHETDMIDAFERIGLSLDRIDRKAECLEADNARLRGLLERAGKVIAPFSDGFASARDDYSRRYANGKIGYENFDKMPDQWPMEKLLFNMGEFRALRALAAEIEEEMK